MTRTSGSSPGIFRLWGRLSTVAIQKLQALSEKPKYLQPPSLFPAGLTASMRFDDIEQLAGAIRKWNHEGIQIAPGEFQSRLDLVHTAGMQIHRVRLSLAILVRGFAVPGSIVLGVQSGGKHRAKWRGRVLEQDEVVFFDGEKEIDFQTTGPSEITAISFDRQLLARHVEAICGSAPPARSGSDRLKVLSRAKAHALIRTWRELTDASLTWGAQLSDDALARHFEARILEVLFTNVAQARRESGITERHDMAQRARKFMVLNMDEPMTITDICAAVGACERTLHLGFRECFGVTPKKFLKLLRLNAARRNLLRPEVDTTVTGVALRWGFFHLAHFAADYAQLFAEPPSQTLRRIRGSV
jgi:AraC family ethanolamine operon transcriptional activator